MTDRANSVFDVLPGLPGYFVTRSAPAALGHERSLSAPLNPLVDCQSADKP